MYYSFYGYNDADDGYTLALSWRIINGEIPYRDFIMVRPPLSPLFHALFLYIIPNDYQIIFDRFFCYLLFALSSLLGAYTIDKAFGLKDFKINPSLLATVGFVFSVNCFPPMGWHTIDAIFFASIGIYILVCFSSTYSVIIGLLFLFLSALCKQPFYLMPIAGVVFVSLLHKNWNKTIISIISILVFTSVFFLILYKEDALKNFIELTTGSTKLVELLSAGFINYIAVNPLYLILLLASWLILKNPFKFKYLSLNRDLVPYFFISILLLIPLARFIYILLFKEVTYQTSFSGNAIGKILFLITIFALVANISREKKWITLWFLILVSWCSSISWGNKTPALFSLPFIFGFLLVSNQFFRVKNIANLAMYILVLGTVTYLIAYQKPYCNPLRQELTYKIDHLFPKLKNIKVSKEIHDKYTELAELIIKYGNNFKTLPGMPLSNYLTNTKSPIVIDWVFNAETNNINSDIINGLKFKKTIIFMEKYPQLISISDSKEKFNSSVAYFIKKNWQKIDTTNYFEIYKAN
ncbi:MAG: hypothetical protein M3Z01_03560 [Thermoproteota archaeon]|nr:hypothetical protein [Thermoproteota archaeon]